MDPTRTAAIAASFALGEALGTATFVARGAMGELWRLRTVDGRSWAVKTLFAWADDEPSGRDVALQEAATAAGIPLPTPRRAVDGRIIVDRVRAYEWVDLAPLPSPPDDATLEEAGRILGTLHALALPPEPGEEVDEWYRTAPSPEDVEELVVRGEAAGRAWAAPLRGCFDRVAELSRLVQIAGHPSDEVIVCHRDFTRDNVFLPAAGGDLVVLDWENAGPLAAEAELGMTIAAWCGSSNPDALLAGYAAGGGTASITGPESFATNAATMLNYLRVLAVHSLEDDGHRVFAEPVLDQLLRVSLDIAVPQGWRT